MKLTTADETKESLISIVDDEACVRESLSSLIRSVGYNAEDYASAEGFLTQGRWDETACLILDVRLSGIGGLELQRRLTEIERERPPIVFISGHATKEEQRWARMRGAVAFLRKPFSDESLLRAVRESIGRRGARLDLDPETPRSQVCPLCHEPALVAEIWERLMREQDDFRASTVEMIKTLNPEWVERDGLCQRCWRFYTGLGRVVNFLRSPDSSPAEAKAEGDATGGIRQKG